MSLYARWLRPCLFTFGAETAHRLAVTGCQIAARLPGVSRIARYYWESSAPELVSQVAGIRFANPLGLAAGWDKSGQALGMLGHVGLGFTEIGSISAEASVGNPRPRLFRIPSERAIAVNYGLPNDGAKRVARRIAHTQRRVPLGINIVTTNRGPDYRACRAQEIFEDYARSVELLHGLADYVMLNLSCPNTGDGQDLFAQPGQIAELLGRLARLHISVPVFLKLPATVQALDHERWLDEVAQYSFVRGFAFNLSPGRPEWLKWRDEQNHRTQLPGAIAGAPVAQHMDQCIASLYARMDRERYSIIGGGGVFTADDAWRKLCLGASLVQIYTALVYEGPSVIRRINQGLLERLRAHGWQHISQAVGSAHNPTSGLQPRSR